MAETSRAGVGIWISACWVTLVCMLFSPAVASADVSFCPPGSDSGQCRGGLGLAVDFSTERLYVADSGNHRIDVFEQQSGAMEFLFSFGTDLTSPTQIAVDNTAGSGAQHSIYVFDGGLVRGFSPAGAEIISWGTNGAGKCQFYGQSDAIAVGPEGNVFVADNAFNGSVWVNRIQKFSPTGDCLDEDVLRESEKVRLVGALAVDLAEDAYVNLNGQGGELFKYDLAIDENMLCQLDEGIETNAVSLDEVGNVVAIQREPVPTLGSFGVITQYSSDCEHLRRWAYGKPSVEATTAGSGVASLRTALGDIFASSGEGIEYLQEPPPGPVIAQPSIKVASVSNTKATISAGINPEGKATTFEVEYVTQAQFEETGFNGASTSGPIPLGGEANFRLHLESALIGCPDPVGEAESGTCLSPETTYRYRISASNADGKGNSPLEGGTFKTEPSLSILATWAGVVGTGSATLSAEVNPLGLPASGIFEYVSEEDFEEDGFTSAVKTAVLDFGEGEAPVVRSVKIAGLAPGTSYLYRLAAENPLIEKLSDLHSLKTFFALQPASCPANEAFRTGPSATLPDCRAYEMVSPLDKNNGDTIALREVSNPLRAVLSQASTSGERMAYGSYRSFGDAESAPYTVQYVAARGSDGWASHGVVPRRERTVLGILTTNDTELKAFSPDLCEAFLRTVADPPLDPDAVFGYTNIYRRSDEECAGKSYEAITTHQPPHVIPFEYAPLEFQGASADGTTAIYVASDNLVEEAPTNLDGHLQLYAHGPGGKTRYVCLMPDGSPSTGACSAGTATSASGQGKTATLQNAISADGSRVFWSSGSGTISPGPIYLRINPLAEQSEVEGGQCTEPAKACTIAISEDAEEESAASSSRFWAAANEGSKAVLTSGSDLYEVEVGEEGEALGTETTMIAGEVKGVAAVSEDAEWIYFVSEEALESGAEAGEPNLYAAHDGEVELVGVLAEADVTPAGIFTPTITAVLPWLHNTRLSADGRHLAFMSRAPLTGYDNTDAASGKSDAEVFLYDAAEGELACGSCNPSGGRPGGANVGSEVAPVWVAGSIPGWTNSLYSPRTVSDDGGRLYFESFDALVARDTNKLGDVYQWEAPGIGDCTTASRTFSPVNGGCVDLISSGQGKQIPGLVGELNPPSAIFLDASPDGDDVFFATAASLVSQDYGLIDVYDAREGGGLPPPPPSAVECEGEACQGPTSPPIPPSNSSSSYKGPGNVREAAKPHRCPKGKHKVKRKGKTRCVKNRRKGAVK